MERSYIKEIENKLKNTIELEKRRDGLSRLMLFMSIACSVVFIFILLETAGNYNSNSRTVLFYSLLSLLFILFIIVILLPTAKDFYSFVKPNYIGTAKTVGSHYPEIKDELLNSMQLIVERNFRYSNILIDAAFERIYKKVNPLDFNKVVSFSPVKDKTRLFFSILAIVVSSLLIFPELSSASLRLINYEKNFIPPSKFIFEIFPGNKEITKGESVSITVAALGVRPNEITLLTKSEEQSDYSENKLTADSTDKFRFELISLKNSTDYYAHADGVSSEIFRITVLNRPIISSLNVEIFPPAYTALRPISQRDNGNITTLPGSRVKLSISSSRELSTASISFSDSTSRDMKINYSSASAEYNVFKEVNYQILIKDIQNFTNSNPISYTIKTIPDLTPAIELISPVENLKLGNDPRIPIHSKIKDDYGFSKMTLNYRLVQSKYRAAEENFTSQPVIISKERKEDEIYNVWDLTPLVLAEGESIAFYLEIFDNDKINGPKSAKTQLITLSVPSIDELFQSAETKQENAAEDLAKTFKDAEKLQQELKKISDDLKQNNKEISWQEKERIEKAVENFQKLGEKLEDVSKKLSDMQKEMMNNNLLSKETLDKYNELQELLNEFNSEELKQAFKQLQDALKGMQRNDVQMSLEEMKNNEEMIKASIERTMNLLKRIQVEQKVDELVKRAEDLTQKLEELKNNTGKNNLSDSRKRNELANKQNDVTESLKQLEEEMKKLAEKMKDMKDMPKETLEKTQQEYDKQNNEELSEEAMKALQQMQLQPAMQNQQQLSANMQSMKNRFSQLQQQLQQMNQMRTFFDMAKILDDLLTLSKQQEDLKNKTEQLSPLSPGHNKNTREQNQIQSDLGKILESMKSISQKTFAITPEMGRALGRALYEMQQSQIALQNQSAPTSVTRQTEAMRNINEAASLMKGAMDMMMQGGQSGGMMGMMQQLQQIAQQQMNLNQLTQMMNQGQLTPDMMAQMQRLAQQQEMIRKSLEQLNREARESGESKRLAGNLESILKEMKEVVSNLQSEKLNDELVKQQEKILSRMLDAQRSLNERDFEENRKSNTGQNTTRTSPPDLILSTEEGKNKLRDELQRAIREGYKKDYEDLIRKYFEALEKSQK